MVIPALDAQSVAVAVAVHVRAPWPPCVGCGSSSLPHTVRPSTDLSNPSDELLEDGGSGGSGARARSVAVPVRAACVMTDESRETGSRVRVRVVRVCTVWCVSDAVMQSDVTCASTLSFNVTACVLAALYNKMAKI